MRAWARALSAFSRMFARGAAASARRREALGELEEATALYLEAGQRSEASRLYVLRANHAPDPRERAQLLEQAIGLADKQARAALRRRRSKLLLELASSQAMSLAPSELSELGRELERLGEMSLAAEAYRLAGDVDAEARSLVSAGAVEQLEAVLDAHQEEQRLERRRDAQRRRVRDLDLAGRRREALALGDDPSLVADEVIAAMLREIELRRVRGPCVELELDRERVELALGDEITIGRAEATVALTSPCVSREHLRVRPTSTGPEAIDLGSHNGTTLAGARIDMPVSVPERGELELVLGGEVRISVGRWREAGVRIQVGGRRVHAPLGPLSVGGWTVSLGPDQWLELRATDCRLCLGELLVGPQIQLCRGDELRERLGAPSRLTVVG